MKNLKIKAIVALEIILVSLSLALAGCGGQAVTPGGTPAPDKQIPAGCEKSWIYTQTDFLPYGPIVIRTGIATAAAVKPEIKPMIILVSLVAWKALDKNDLSGVTAAFKDSKAAQYITPAVVAISSLMDQGVGQSVKLDACDLNVLKSLMKNIGLDAGAQASDFQ
jgi:hypothetical protein